MNSCETQFLELMCSPTRQMVKTGSPKELWDDSLELVARIRSVTALDVFDLQGDTPEAKMEGHSADISNISAFGWYD